MMSKENEQRKLGAPSEVSGVPEAEHSLEEPTSILRDSEDTVLQMDDSKDVDDNDEECYSEKLPYVPMNVEEVSSVKSLKLWMNSKVRVIGIFLKENSNHVLYGTENDHGKIIVNVENLDQYPRCGEILEVFGFLYKDRHHIYEGTGHSVPLSTSSVKLKVMFYRPIFDVRKNRKASLLVKPYIPLFVKRYVN